MSPQLTRYIIGEQLRPFIFFVVVFTGLIWLTQSLRVIDTVVNNNQGARVFLEFSLLLLPQVMAVVLPVSAFGATLYAVNRLFTESEIVAMGAAGMSRLALARPVILFGGAVMLAMVLVTTVLSPLAARALREQVASLRADIANSLLFEGQFLTPAAGLTVYVRESDGTGGMLGVFVHDQREAGIEVTYTARQALLQRTEGGPRLVMFDGTAQRKNVATDDLQVLRFDSLVYDLAPFMQDTDARMRRPSERFFPELVAPTETQLAGFTRGRFYAEGHEQLSAPLYALTLPVIAIAAVVGGGFTRHGYAGRIGVAIGVGVVVRLLGLAAKAATTGSAMLWPSLYIPPLLGLALALWHLAEGGARARVQVT